MGDRINMDKKGFLSVCCAIRFASIAHRYRVDNMDSAFPGITHSVCMMEALWGFGFDNNVDLLIATVIFDVLAFNVATYEEVRDEFGPIVANTVQDVPFNDTGEKAVSLIDNPLPRLIKLVDLMIRCRDVIEDPPTEWSLERIRGFRIYCTWIVLNLGRAHAASTQQDELERELYSIIMEECMPEDFEFGNMEEELQNYYNLLKKEQK